MPSSKKGEVSTLHCNVACAVLNHNKVPWFIFYPEQIYETYMIYLFIYFSDLLIVRKIRAK